MDDEFDTQPQWVKEAGSRRASAPPQPVGVRSLPHRAPDLSPATDDLAEYVLPNAYAFCGMISAALAGLGVDFPVMYTSFVDVNMISEEHFAYGFIVALLALGAIVALLVRKYTFAAGLSVLILITAGLDLWKVLQKLQEMKALLADPQNDLGPVFAIFSRSGVDFGLPFIMITSVITFILCICARQRERNESYP